MVGLEVFSSASGKRWKNAPPNKPPVAKLMRMKRMLFKIFSFIRRKKTPIKEIKLTMILAPIDQNNSII